MDVFLAVVLGATACAPWLWLDLLVSRPQHRLFYAATMLTIGLIVLQSAVLDWAGLVVAVCLAHAMYQSGWLQRDREG